MSDWPVDVLAGYRWPFDPALKEFGAAFEPCAYKPGQGWWKLIKAEGPVEWGGRVSIFVDVWDEQGHRIVGVPVRQWWNNGDEVKATEPKTGEPFGVDFVMNAAGNAYGIVVADGSPSDRIWGMGLPQFKPHHVFKLIFQRQPGVVVPEPPTPAPGGETGAMEAIRAQYQRTHAEMQRLGKLLDFA